MQKAKKWISSLNEVIDFKDLPLEVIFSKTLDILVENNENTNLAGAQIKFNNKVYRSKSFQQTEFVHHEIFLASIDVDGCIELYYKESKDQVHPFTEEDIVILSGLSKRLGNLICVKLANKALQNSDKKYQKIIERFNDPTYLLYNDRLEFVNDQFLKLFGYTRQEIEDEDFTFFRLIAPESIPLMEQRRRLLLDDKAIPSIYEFAALAKGNKKIICETSVSYLPYKSGTAVQGVIRDVTERRIAEQKLRDTKEQLAAALEIQKNNQRKLLEVENLKSVQELAAGVAHEFSQPLQALTNYLNLLKFEREDSMYTDKCMDMVARIAELTKSLRHITSIERKEYVDAEIMDLEASSANHKHVKDKRVLILDDEIEIQNTMVEMFEAYGYQCDGALNGVEGLELVERNKYWLIVSDVMMPHMSGPEFFRRVQRDHNYNHFIFLTGYEIPDSEKMTISKADAILSKPISFENFFKTIDNISVGGSA